MLSVSLNKTIVEVVVMVAVLMLVKVVVAGAVVVLSASFHKIFPSFSSRDINLTKPSTKSIPILANDNGILSNEIKFALTFLTLQWLARPSMLTLQKQFPKTTSLAYVV